MNYFYSVLLLLLFSCNTLPVHQQNLIDQQKTMLKQDEQSRKKQQNIRDSRKKRVKNKNMSKDRFFIN